MGKRRTITLDVTHLSERQIDDLKRAFTVSAQEQNPEEQDVKQELQAMAGSIEPQNFEKWSKWNKRPENKGKTVFDYHKVFWEEPINNGATQADIRRIDSGYFRRLHEALDKDKTKNKDDYLPRKHDVRNKNIETVIRRNPQQARDIVAFYQSHPSFFKDLGISPS